MLDIKKTLAHNVSQLLDSRKDISRLNLSKQIRVADGTLGRIKYGTSNPNVETVAQIAAFFHFEPWQLLVDGFDMRNPPTIKQSAQDAPEPERPKNSDEDTLLALFRQLQEPERTYLLNHAEQYASMTSIDKSPEDRTGTDRR